MIRHGRPVIEPVPAQKTSGMDFDKAVIVRRDLGLDGLAVTPPPGFGDPAFSRQVLGLSD